MDPIGTNQLTWFKLLLNEQSSGAANCSTDVWVQSEMSPQMLAHMAIQQALEQRLRNTLSRIPEGKQVVDVVADYLRELVQATHNALKNTYHASLFNQMGGKHFPIHYVLTVPAVRDYPSLIHLANRQKEADVKLVAMCRLGVTRPSH